MAGQGPNTIRVHPSATKALARVARGNRKLAVRIADRIDALADDPLPAAGEPVTGIPGNAKFWRLRVGDYRIVYHYDGTIVTVFVLRVAKRGDVYRNIQRVAELLARMRT